MIAGVRPDLAPVDTAPELGDAVLAINEDRPRTPDGHFADPNVWPVAGLGDREPFQLRHVRQVLVA